MQQTPLALVTGGNRGIGFAIVNQLCHLGIQTIFTSTNPHDGLDAVAKHGSMASLVDYHPLDVSDNNSVATIARYVQKKYARLDILINNAGVNYDTWQRAARVAMAEVEHTIGVNFLGTWRMCNALLPLLHKSSDPRIINVSSGSGTIANINGATPAYSLSKNGVNMLTKSLAADLAETPITVNAVCPGWVRTDMGGKAAPRSVEQGAETIVWLATRSDNDLTGKFFRDKEQIPW